MPETVLITGGAGYVGSILCEHLLQAGFLVRVLDKMTFEPSLFHLCANPNFDFILGDVRDEPLVAKAMAGADVIIPLAAIVGAPASKRDPWMTTAINLDAIRLITKLRSPRQLIIYPTTNSGYGAQTGEVFCTEETPLEPISLYGTTKAEAETDVLASGNSITLRLATVFGMSPRMRLDLLVNHFTYAAVTDGYMIIFEKHFKRNYVHVRDVADCFIHCIRNQQAMIGRPYNVGLDSANLSKEELAEKIKEHVPRFFIHYSEIGTDPDKRNYIVSNQRLREAGFEAKRSIDDGIVELLKGYRMLGRGRYQNV
jgi:nucleoside-diphosphate-sugar epimerase